ncbi:MAG: MarR family transcriptional regulator [Parachlamydia sp.]|jgi:DNA-binding MarR family transcriptional regulator|nr:MarR family transcriptional regulator [Parachlamydia sp.]
MKKNEWHKISHFEGPEESPGFLMWQVSTLWRRQVEAALAKLGLTHAQFVILASVGWLTKEGSQVSQVEIARHCGTDVTMTSQVLRTLERNGYIERKQREGDERSKLPCLTKKGGKAIEQAIPLVESVDAGFFENIKKDTKKFVEILQKLSMP